MSAQQALMPDRWAWEWTAVRRWMTAEVAVAAEAALAAGYDEVIYSGAALREVRLNGEVCSEGYLNAALAGEFGKPVLFVAGDQYVVEDAHRYAPEAVFFVTKQSFGWRSQMSLPPAQVQRLMKEAIARALGRAALPDPFRLPGPYHLELEMTSQPAAEMLSYLPGVERQGAFGVSVSFNCIASLMRFLSFVIIYTSTGVPAI